MDVPARIAINAHKAGWHRSQPQQVSIEGDKGDTPGTNIQPDAIAFKSQLELCLDFFRSLIDAMVRTTKESAFAGAYFHPIIRQLDNELVRFEIWASDVGALEADFGKSVQAAYIDLELTRYITKITEDLQSRLEESTKQVEQMRSLIAKLSGRRLLDL